MNDIFISCLIRYLKIVFYLPKLYFLLIYFLESKIKCLALQRFKLPYFHLITQTIKQSRNKLLGKWFHCCFYWSLINVTWKIACLQLIWVMNNMKQKNFPRFACFVFISVGLGFSEKISTNVLLYQVFVRWVIYNQIDSLFDWRIINISI